MNLADVFTVVLLVVGLLTEFVGWWLVVAGLFPEFVERCAEKLGARPVGCWLMGLLVGAPLFIGAGVLSKVMANAPGKLASIVFMSTILLAALAGTSGLALRIGRGLVAARAKGDLWRCVRRGGIVLALTYGTVFLVPVTLLAGIGALVLVSFSRRDSTPALDQ